MSGLFDPGFPGSIRISKQHCTKLLPIESVVQYRFAIPNPLKTRPEQEGCKTG